MIQVYSPGNENFTKNGNAVIFPISCTVNAEINGSWILELITPLDDEGRYKLLEINAVIKAPSFNGEQLFRIRQTSKQDSGVTVTAEPIFLDSVGDCFLLDVRPTNKSGQEALDLILSPNAKYSGTSNISKRETAYFIRKNAMEAIAGREDASFLSRWGGEILYNNYEIIINDRIGGDYGVSLLYGKNIPVNGVAETVDMEGVVTRIIPKAYNGHMLPGSSPWVNSPLINSYPTIFTKVIDFEYIRLASDVTGEVEEGVIVCQTLTDLYNELRSAATEQFTAGIDKPSVTISADMVLLENTEEYKEYKDLERVSLGDTIHLRHKRLGIVTDARIVALTYDSIKKAVIGVQIGDITPTFLDKVASTVNAVGRAITKRGEVKAEQINGFIDGLKTQLRIQNTIAERQEARAILFEDLDPNSPSFGALSIGTQGWEISKERTPDDRDWNWTTAATAGGLIADVIVTGLLSDKNNLNYWNLDTGEFSLSTGATVGGQTIQQIANGAASAAVDAQTQQQIFNKLTNNGAAQGIYLSNGQLYVNGTYIQAGIIDAGLITAGTLSAIDIDGVNITGSTITGNTISGGTISGSTITTTGEIDDDATITDTVRINKGRITATRNPTSNTENRGIFNSDVVQLHHKTGGTIDQFARLNVEALSINNDYFWHVNAKTGKIQGETDEVITTLDIPNRYFYLKGLNGNYVELQAEEPRLALSDGSTITRIYKGRAEMYENTTTFKWGTEYKRGLSLAYGNAVFAGHITYSSRAVDFFVPLNISAEGRTVSFPFPDDLSVRTINGYLNESQYLSSSGITVTSTCLKNGIKIRLTSSTAFTNATNNTPVAVQGTFNFTFLT